MAKKSSRRVSDGVTARGRYFGAIFTDLNGKFSLLLKGYAALNARMDKLEQGMAGLGQRIDDLETKLEEFHGETNQKFAALFNGQQEFFEEMRRFNLRLSAVEERP